LESISDSGRRRYPTAGEQGEVMDQGTALIMVGLVGVTGTLLGTLLQPIVEELRAVFARRRDRRERRAEFQRTTLMAIRDDLAKVLGASGLAISPDEFTRSLGRLRVLTESADDEDLREALRAFVASARQGNPEATEQANQRLGEVLRRQGEPPPAGKPARGRRAG
jgi:hypothetical protein